MVSENGITYSEDFKHHYIPEHEKGKLPREIFEEAGLDVELIGKQRIHSASKRWRVAYYNEGVNGSQDTCTENSGRPRERVLTSEEKSARLEAKKLIITCGD